MQEIPRSQSSQKSNKIGKYVVEEDLFVQNSLYKISPAETGKQLSEDAGQICRWKRWFVEGL